MTDRFIARQLRPEQKPRTIYEYYVTGSGDFPTDMLRYDAAYPASTESAIAMTGEGKRSVLLQSYREPTIARWSSFLWSLGTEKLH